MKKVIKKIILSGVWLVPGAFFGTEYLLNCISSEFMKTRTGWLLCAVGSMLPVIWAQMYRQRLPDKNRAFEGKEKAKYPEIPKQLLCDNPKGIYFGKKDDRYICKPIEEDGHIMLIGGSGTGKSSALVIPTIINNQDASIFAIDIKGELSLKATRYDDDSKCIINPQDRYTVGYDPLYELNDSSSSQDILETMQTIAFSLIPLSASVKDPFWLTSSRNLLIGFLIYYYKQGIKDFIGLIDKILSQSARKIIDEVIENSKPMSAEYRYIIQFAELAEETLGGIVAQMNNHIIIFANDQDIRYCLRINPHKVSPLSLEEGKSIYVAIKEEKLTAYYDFLQLIINQFLSRMEKREESAEPVIFIIDELARVVSAGKIEHLLDGARTLRSRKVSLFLITQSLESLMGAYTENEVIDLISNCKYIATLSATSTKTQKYICEWAGKYKVRKTSWSDNRTNVSYENQNIIDPADLMSLSLTDEEILISPFGYCRFRKHPYYKDKKMKQIVERNIKYNTLERK